MAGQGGDSERVLKWSIDYCYGKMWRLDCTGGPKKVIIFEFSLKIDFFNFLSTLLHIYQETDKI